jgi:anti-sigma B factor antagonist
MTLTITDSKSNGVIVVYLSGAIFFGEESTYLRTRVKGLLDQCPRIVLDFGNVTRIDSGGLGALVALYASARKLGGDIKLASLGSHPKEVLQITRLLTLFDVFESAEEAVASITKAAAAG